MIRKEVLELCQIQALPKIAALYGAPWDGLVIYDDFEGCQNLVYDYMNATTPMILRISFRPDRPPEQIMAEIHFVQNARFCCLVGWAAIVSVGQSLLKAPGQKCKSKSTMS